MNIQLRQTVKLKSGYCKGKKPEADATENCFLVQLIEVPNGKDSNYSVGSKLIILKEGCWRYTQKIKVNGEVVAEQQIVFPTKNIIGTIVDVKGAGDDV
jgi:hypothetical protein